MKRLVLLSVCVLLLFAVGVCAQKEYHMTILAVQERAGNTSGSTADLFLEVKEEGSGRVFLDTFPLTKLDTQISTRFAKELSCEEYGATCNDKDFIYTIKSSSSIIGGPSAGAAIAALTTIATLDLPYNKKVAVTGTINSGMLIGPVGGVKEKIEAGQQAGLEKVLIPKWTANATELQKYGEENLSIEVILVEDLADVLYEFTAKDLSKNVSIAVDATYEQIMKGLQEQLCTRREKILSEVMDSVGLNESLLNRTDHQKELITNATSQENYYAAASFCFSDNIFLTQHYYQEKKPSQKVIIKQVNKLTVQLTDFEEELANESIDTISDLQTLMVVSERLDDAKFRLTQLAENKTLEEQYNLLGYAQERFFSAVSWHAFFAMDGKKLVVDNATLARSCLQKIAEAEEREQYAKLFAPSFSVTDQITSAKGAQEQQDYAFCLIEATQAKAQATSIVSSLGLAEDVYEEYLVTKKHAAQQSISKTTAQGTFPILGYSYYRYAQSLDNVFSQLLYYEYALEMSDLGIYFADQEETVLPQVEEKYVYLVVGFVVGISVGFIFRKRKYPKLVIE